MAYRGEGGLRTTNAKAGNTGRRKLGSERSDLWRRNVGTSCQAGDNVTGTPSRARTLCYFHSRRRLAAAKPADSIEIPLLEERCVIQVTITQVLRAIVNNTIDRSRASLLLYGLQLALQSVDRKEDAIPFGSVEAISETSDGEELAADPYDEDEEDEDDEEDSDESSDDSGGEVDEDSDDDEEDDDEDDSGDGLDNETTGELIAGQKYLESVSNALDRGDMRLAARLLAESSP